MRTSRPTLLVVDPDPSRREAAVRQWKRSFRVVTAADGVTAFEAIRATPPAVVFAEWDLPDIDGTMFERVVRANTELCAIPIVFTLGWKSRERVVHQLVSAGMLERFDDHCFSALVRGVTAMTRGTPRRRRSPKSAAKPVAMTPTDEPERGYLAKRLMIA